MSDTLMTTVAELMGIDPGQLSADRALSGARLQGSLGRSILDAALRRRLNIQSEACYSAKTFGELESAINGTSVSSSPANGSPVLNRAATVSTSQVASCGIDIELVQMLPVTSDYWTHEFYQTNFTKGEIAYCLTQEKPLEHFAARWCAKEALKKCEPSLLNESMQNIEVITLPSGAPSLRHRGSDLPHALSLSHTAESAAAVVVRVPAPVVEKPKIAAAIPAPSSARAKIPLAVSLLAVVIAIIALILALHR